MIRNGCVFEWETVPEGLLVKVRGEIDHHGAISLRRGVDALIWERAPQMLILDMSGITLMDSSGLGFIMGRYKLMNECGGELKVQNPSACVLRILRVSGFERRIEVVHTEAKEKRKES